MANPHALQRLLRGATEPFRHLTCHRENDYTSHTLPLTSRSARYPVDLYQQSFICMTVGAAADCIT